MAQPSQADLLARYKGRVERSRKYRAHEGYDALWDRMKDVYRNRPYSKKQDNQDRISVAFGFSTVNIVFPSVSINYPRLTVEAMGPQDADRAVIAEAVLAYQIRHCGIKPEARRTVKDSLIFGHGWTKVGWRLKHKMAAVPEAKRNQQVADANAQADDFAQANPEMAGDLPTEEDIDSGVPEEELVTLEDGPYAIRVDPKDIFIDPEATTPEDLKWICQRLVKPLEEVQSDPRYDSRARNSIGTSADSTFNQDWLPDGKDSKDYGADVQRVTIYEFYDIVKGTMSVFSPSASSFLVKPKDIPYEFGHPFVFLGDYEVPGEFYPMGELEAIESLMDELNKTRSQLMNARNQLVPKYLFDQDMFDDAGVSALESPVPMTMVPVNTAGKPMQESIMPMPTQNINPELFTYSQDVQAELDLVSGVTEFQRGTAPNLRRTATEVSQIQDAANARAADKQAQIEDFYRRLGERLLQLNQQYLTGEQAARITRQDGTKVWFTYTHADICGQFDFSVESGSTAPHNEAYRKQQARDFMQAFSPFFNRIIDPQATILWAMQQFGIKDPERFMLPPDAYRIFPTEKLIETMNYADVPDDVKRQMEQISGFQPSQLPSTGTNTDEPLGTRGSGLTIDYADAPPDVQRQMEERAGWSPSQMGGGMVDPASGHIGLPMIQGQMGPDGVQPHAPGGSMPMMGMPQAPQPP
ncbi:MAG: hypothetical protein ABJB05_11360, partial [Parafilimonas sp.]